MRDDELLDAHLHVFGRRELFFLRGLVLVAQPDFLFQLHLVKQLLHVARVLLFLPHLLLDLYFLLRLLLLARRRRQQLPVYAYFFK